jgi:hypothetical protein
MLGADLEAYPALVLLDADALAGMLSAQATVLPAQGGETIPSTGQANLLTATASPLPAAVLLIDPTPITIVKGGRAVASKRMGTVDVAQRVGSASSQKRYNTAVAFIFRKRT